MQCNHCRFFSIFFSNYRSGDGRILIASSTDGYCSVITFSDDEIGTPYREESQETLESGVGTTQESQSDFTQSTPHSAQTPISDIEPIWSTQESAVVDLSDSPVPLMQSSQGCTTPSSKVGRRVQLVTLSSPKSKKKLINE